jgi:hypothetical protein
MCVRNAVRALATIVAVTLRWVQRQPSALAAAGDTSWNAPLNGPQSVTVTWIDRPPLAGAGQPALCIKVLAGIVSQETVPPAGRVSSAGFLLDRLGRAPQPHAGEDGNDIESPSGKLSRAMRVDLDLPSGGWARSKEAAQGEFTK